MYLGHHMRLFLFLSVFILIYGITCQGMDYHNLPQFWTQPVKNDMQNIPTYIVDTDS